MPALLRTPNTEWRDGVLWSTDYEDSYASVHGARAEREHVFLRGHGVGAAGDADPGRWADFIPARTGTSSGAPPRIVFAELGFGAGISLLATWAAFRAHVLPRDPRALLEWVSVEGAPLDAEHIMRAATSDSTDAPLLRELAQELCAAWPARIPGLHRRTLNGGRVKLTLLFGEPLDLLPRVTFLADAWNLDGFAPSRNPEMWSPQLLEQVAMHAKRGTTTATYSVAASVRSELTRVGFTVETRPGVGGKREITVARWDRDAPRAPERALPGAVTKPAQGAAEHPTAHAHAHSHTLPAWFAQPSVRAETWQSSAVVIGAGLAGAAAARALAERGMNVHVLERGAVAGGASGAPRAILAPHLASWHSIQARVVAHAFLHARAEMERLSIPHESCGMLQVLHEDDEWAHESAIKEWGWPPELLRIASPQESEALAGTSLAGRPAIAIPLACTTQPALTVRALLSHANIVVHEHVDVQSMHASQHGWRLTLSRTAASASPDPPTTAYTVIVATARGEFPDIPFDGTRGQLTMLAANGSSVPRTILNSGGFALPPQDGVLCIGATHERGNDSPAPTARDDAQNIQQLEHLAPELLDRNSAPVRSGAWVGMRATVNDHLPAVGSVPDSPWFSAAFARLCDGPYAAKWPPAPVLSGLYCTLAHGSRGTSTALLAGELLADIITGGVRCVPDDLLPVLLPQRFLVRNLRRGADAAVP